MLLSRLFYLVGADKLQGPIHTDDMGVQPGTSNKEFLQNFVANLLANAFPNLQPVQIQNFIKSLFENTEDLPKFKLILRDFLIQLKEFAGDNAELFAEDRERAAQDAKDQERERAMKVGGLLKPSEIDDDEL